MKILIIRFGSLGDVVMATALVAALKKKHPASSIDFMVKEEYAEVFKNSPDVSELLLLKKEARDFLSLCELGESLERKYDVIIDLHANFRSRIICSLASTKVLRYRKHAALRRAMAAYSRLRGVIQSLPDFFRDRKDNVIRNYFEAAASLGVTYAADVPVIHVKKKAPQAVRTAGLACGARYFTKRWPDELWAALAKELNKAGFKIAFYGGKEDKDQADRIIALSGINADNLTGSTSIFGLAECLSACSVVIANDSAPMHVAGAVGTPVAAIFCSTTPRFGFAPEYGRNIILNSEIACKPCSLHGRRRCWTISFECANAIKVKDVLLAVKELENHSG